MLTHLNAHPVNPITPKNAFQLSPLTEAQGVPRDLAHQAAAHLVGSAEAVS
jgi:hypothetical protein